MGWELMRWSGILRHVSKNYDEVIIGCEYGHDFLYEDFATEFRHFDDLGIKIESRNMWMANHQVWEVDHDENDAFIAPIRELCLDIDNEYHQDFIKWGENKKRYGYDILIHARSTNNLNTGYRNWPVECWEKIVEEYQKWWGKSIACIGSFNGSYHIKNTADLRGMKLRDLANVMASSTVILGPSSGPMHFASLCGLNHIVWSNKTDQGLYDNEDRYNFMWNPLATKHTFIPSWQPDPEVVIAEVNKCIQL